VAEVAQYKAPGQRPGSGDQLLPGHDWHVEHPIPWPLKGFPPRSQQGRGIAVAISGHPRHAGPHF
jgi:hypothetical protein